MAEALFADFDKPTHDDWLEAARVSLRGRPLDSLITQTYEDIDIQPLMGADDVSGAHLDTLPGQFPFRRGTTAGGYRARPWLIAQDIDIAEPAEFNVALLDALANGQTAIVLSDRQSLASPADVERALAGIELRRYPVIHPRQPRSPNLQNAADRAGERRVQATAGLRRLRSAS